MTSHLLKAETTSIGGKEYTVRVLNVADARKIYTRVQRLLAVFAASSGPDVSPQSAVAQMDSLLFAGLAGELTEDDLKLFCDVFGKYSSVDMGDGRTLSLSKQENLDTVFAGDFEHMFDWLQFCIKLNFAGVIEKLKASMLALAKLEADKAQASQVSE